MYKQIAFKVRYEEADVIGGIGYFENDKLVKVICGCCGGTFEPDEVTLISTYDNWIDLADTILGD